MIDQLRGQYQAVCAAAGVAPGDSPDMTAVFDAGQNSADNFAHLAGAGLHYIGSVPASDCPDLTALPASKRVIVDKERFGGLTAFDTRREVYGAERRAILTHSPELHSSQARGFDGTTLAKVGRKLDELAATLARGKTRRSKDKVQAEIQAITRKPWVRRVITWQLDGDQPRDLRLTWHVDHDARTALEEELFGKHVLISPRRVAASRVAAASTTVASALSDTADVAWRNLLTQLRTPQALVFATIQPVIFVLLFRYAFGGAIHVPGTNYVDFLMPGIFAQTVAFGAVGTAVGLSGDLRTGILVRFRTLPMARIAVLGGRTVADLARNLLVVAVMTGVGFAAGFRSPHGAGGLFAAL